MSAINPGRPQKREFEGDHPPSQRARVAAEDNQFLADDLTRLENDFNHLLAGQYNYDLVRRVEAFRTHHLTSLSHSTLYSFSERLLGRFTTTTSMRVDRLYNNILDRHNLQKDYVDHSRTLIEEAISSYDCERIAFLCRDLSYMERMEVLKVAVEKNHIPSVQAVLKGKVDDYILGNMVVIALKQQNISMAQFLLGLGPISDVYRPDAALYAVQNQNIPILEALQIKDLASSRPCLINPLVSAAAYTNNTAIFEKIFALGEIDEDTKGSALLSAAKNENASIFDSLLKREGTISDYYLQEILDTLVKKGNLTLLDTIFRKYEAISENLKGELFISSLNEGHLPIAEFLLRNEIQIPENQIETAIRIACRKNYSSILEPLIHNDENLRGSAVEYAAGNGNIAIVKELLSDGKNIQDLSRGRALEWAIQSGHGEIARFLFGDGSQIPVTNREHGLYLAANQNLRDIVALLFGDGSLVSKDSLDRALMCAAFQGHREIVEIFFLNSRRLDRWDRHCVLRYAASKGYSDIARFILDNSDGISDEERNEFIRIAANCGHGSVVDVLLENNQDLRIQFVISAARDGQTISCQTLVGLNQELRGRAVRVAAKNHQLETVRALLSDGGVISNEDRNIAVGHAVRNGNPLILQILLENGGIYDETQWNCLAIARRDRRDDLIAALNRAQILVEPGVFRLSFEEVQANPRAFLEKVAAEGFPKRIDLLNSSGNRTDVDDVGGVRKGFVRTLFASLQPLYNLGANVIPTAETEAQKELFRILGRFLSKLDEANHENQDPFLIGSFIHTRFYEILKTVATEENPEIQKQRVAGILSLDSNYATLVNAILNPNDENALKAYAEVSYCLDKGIDEWEPATDPADTLQAAKDALESYIAPARCILEGASEDLKKTILTEDPEEIVRLFQGAPVSQEALIHALTIQDEAPSPLLTQQLQWIREKATSSDVEWCTRFVKWATERDCIAIEGAIYLTASHGNLMAHTCSNTVDLPSALDNREDFLAALDSVLDGELNRV